MRERSRADHEIGMSPSREAQFAGASAEVSRHTGLLAEKVSSDWGWSYS
jgi:hypothetical protein